MIVLAFERLSTIGAGAPVAMAGGVKPFKSVEIDSVPWRELTRVVGNDCAPSRPKDPGAPHPHCRDAE